MGKFAELGEKLKSIKHIRIILAVAVFAVVIAVYFSCLSCSTMKTDTESDLTSADYATAMQVRLERIISQIAGVGNASVIINWDKSITTSYGSSLTENPKATGVIVVCDGGADTKVKIDVIFAVSTLLDLSIEKIVVYPKSN